MHPASRLPENLEQAGLSYAESHDGVELPVVDVGHPAFRLSISDPEQRTLVDAFLREQQPLVRLPEIIRRIVLRIVLRGSVLARGIREADGSFLSGMGTYLLKLGPENLGSAWAKPIDRRIAAALPALSVRLRLQDMTRLIADALAARLEREPPDRPLCLLNIGGGTAIDSLNALITLARERRALLEGRRSAIEVLDVDPVGPAFGQRALASLLAEGGALFGLSAQLRHRSYSWADASALTPVLDELDRSGAIALASSEGALFEYGSDREIVDHLRRLGERIGEGFSVIGSVTRADAPIRRLHETSRAATRPRGLDVFRALASSAGYRIERVIERPFSDHVTLVRE